MDTLTIIQFENSDLITMSSLENWLEGDGFIINKTTDNKNADRSTMGIDPNSLIAIILGSAAVVELAKSIHVWITATRPRMIITIKHRDKSITIDTSNSKDVESLLSRASEIFKSE